jgi:type IV pilus assembly protein PilY1
MLRPTSRIALVSLSIAGLAIAMLQAFSQAHAATANMDISTVPLDVAAAAKPNIIFGLDDSGSMDFEVLLPTNDGAAWWQKPSSGTSSFVDGTGKLWFNANGTAGVDGSNTWYKYAYLFPDGNGTDGRVNTDATYDHFAIAPIPAYAYFRSYQYNPLYYNPYTTYVAWNPAYLSGATRTFSDSTTPAARSHPWLPTSGTATTINLTASLSSASTNWTFRMLPGMVIPGASISGIVGRKNGGTWNNVTTNVTIAAGDTWDVQIPYYPATYYIIDTSCTSADVTSGACATAPDGSKIRRYEIKSGNTFPSGRTYAAEMQNFANWFTYYRKRKLMLGGAMGSVLSQVRGVRGGVVKFNSRSTVTMYDFNSTTDSTNYRQILGTVYTNPANGGTPTRDALDYIGQQYMRTDASAPIQYACQRNASFILTDGFANNSGPTVPSYNKTTWGNGTPFTTIYANTLADEALYYFTANLQPSMPSGLVPFDPTNTRPDADRNPNLHMNTYGLTIGSKGTIYGVNAQQTDNPYTYPPTWPNPTQNRNPTSVDDLWHATINGRGQMYTTTDVTGTVAKIQAMVADLLNKSGAASAVAVSNVNIRAGDNTAYASVYSTGGWYGDLLAFSVDVTTGAVNGSTPSWSARDLLEARDPTSTTAPPGRVIATYNPTWGSGTGVPFRWASLNGPQQALLSTIASAPTLTNGQETLDFLRGSRSPQEADGYRIRTYILGDIIDAEPVVVRSAVGEYADVGYTPFRNMLDTRKAMVYQAANDGMLHAFDAATGAESWAYVPNLVFPNLSELASPNYQHKYYVDGTPAVGDVDFANIGSTVTTSNWHTVLVGGLRGGGKGYYALDVTSPDAADENAAAGKVLWEFPNATTSATVVQNLGNSFGKPLIVKTRAFGWVIVVTSGYNSTTTNDGKGRLYFLRPSTGMVLRELVTTDPGSLTNQTNLGQISGFVTNSQQDLTVEQIYGGDNLGNIWRFDVSNSDPNQWSVAKLAALTDASGNPQPITSAPELTVIQNKRVVIVGTGRLLGDTDISSTAVQSVYAIVDNGTTTPLVNPLRTKLTQKTLTVAAGGIRNINSDAIDWINGSGWYFDLPAGERVTGDPTLAYGTLIFTTNQPSPIACSSGSFLYAVDATTGGQVAIGNFATGETPWTGKSIAQSLSTRPVVVVLPSGQINSLVRSADGGIMSNRLPLSWNRKVKKVSWKEIIR